MKKFIEEFKEFALGGNIIDMAVGIIVGGAFNSVVTALVNDIFNPLIGLVVPTAEPAAFNVPDLISTVISFFLTALCLFLVIKAINTAKKLTEKKKTEEAAAAPAEPSEEVKLLTEIRDALAKKK